MKYLVGNWKSNKTFKETYHWFDEFAKDYRVLSDLQVVVAVPFPFIVEAHKKVSELALDRVSVAAQDVSPYPFGSYTGSVTSQMVSDYVDYAIVGHSERRNYFGESHLEIAKKTEQLLENKITPVLCLDKPYAQKQLAGLDPAVFEKLIIAYEPLDAIGTGNPADPENIKTVVAEIRNIIGTEKTPIIYGGSTNAQNAHTYLKIDGISGLLPGGASLKADEFVKMTQAYA